MRVVVATLVAVFAVVAQSAAAAAPPGGGLVVEEGVFTCNGGQPVTIVHPAGSTGWINGQHVVILSFTFAGPEGTFTKTSGNKQGLTPTYTCVGQEGPVTLTVLAAPVPPG